ncbi:hypothetical protein SEA_PINKCREEK_96 [Mycobacterium phage Pinkcreek]|nr:hypothetical protein SEA_PINKCREEK_96 [Mycobacterium phage Pinkcreek]
MRIIRAREQFDMLAPWLHTAAPGPRLEGPQRPGVGVDPSLYGPPTSVGQGNPAQLPPPDDNMGDPDAPWARHDWREAVANGTYGHFHSPARPPSSGDTPHPAELLKQMRPHLARAPRTITVDHDTKVDKKGNPVKVKVPRPSWAEMIANAKEPDVDPAGLLPPNETFRQHVEHMKERIRRGRGYGSPGGPVQLPPPGSHGDAYAHLGPNMNPEDQLAHLHDRVQNGHPGQENGGNYWYSGAHDRSKDIAEKTHGDQERVVGTDSALSPLKDWDVNTEQSAHFNTHYPFDRHPDREGPQDWRVPAPNTQNDKSRRILDAPAGVTRDDIAEILQGPKTKSFMNNILDPTSLREPRTAGQAHADFMAQHGDKLGEEHSPYAGMDPKQTIANDTGFYKHKINPHTGQPDFRYGDQDTTADTHHVRAHSIHPDADLSNVSYGTPDWFSDKMTVGGKTYNLGYELSQRINQTANAELNAEELDAHRHTLPKQNQATGWVQWKGTLDDAGKGAGMVEPGQPVKSFDPGKKNWGLGPLNKGTDENGKPKLDPNPAPRHQYDQGDWWFDPRRPAPGPAFDGDWQFKPGDSPDQHGTWIPPERATTTYTNEPRRGDPQSITHENYDPRLAPNWMRRDKSQQFMGSLGDDFEPIAIHPEPHKIHPDWGGGEPDIEHRGYWQHGPSEMSVMSDWGDENGNINYSLIHQGDTLDVAQDPHEFLSRSPQELADMFGLNPETHDDRGHYGSRLTAETLSYVDEVLKNV